MIDQERRQAFLVLGMHRSGTSALSGALSLAGAERPKTMMPSTTENPKGYWESRVIAKANNHFLKSAKTRWNDSTKISELWFKCKDRSQDRQTIASIISQEYPEQGDILIKDPRICRLLPLWIAALTQAGFAPRCILILRDPREVALSLAARAAIPEFSPAAIESQSHAILLWLRYVLDMEKYSRQVERVSLNFSDLLIDWRVCLEPIFARGWLGRPSSNTADRISDFVNPGHRHQIVGLELGGEDPDELDLLFVRLMSLLHKPSNSSQEQLDILRDKLDQMQQLYYCKGKYKFSAAENDKLSEKILAELFIESSFAAQPEDSPKKAIFISASPKSIGHIYRVRTLSTALSMAGWTTLVKTIGDPSIEKELPSFNIAIVFRAKWDKNFRVIRKLCTLHNIPLVFNIDDLLFDPEATKSGCIAYLDKVSEDERQRWFSESLLYRDALRSCDAAILSTKPLRSAATRIIEKTDTIPNILSPTLQESAELARKQPKLSERDGVIRLVFASGTPTHHRDLLIASQGIARILKIHKNTRLVIVGNIDISDFSDLNDVAQQVEVKPLVAFNKLPHELAKYDVNLCPLEPKNEFCECKSAVRCLVASAVGVPSVASKTAPLAEMIIDGITGLIVESESPESWETTITNILIDSSRRYMYSELCRLDALMNYGSMSWSRRISSCFSNILINYKSAKHSIH
jgi:hypothetical protein